MVIVVRVTIVNIVPQLDEKQAYEIGPVDGVRGFGLRNANDVYVPGNRHAV